MLFGIHFVPTVGPEEKGAADYYGECLELCQWADTLGYYSANIGEHYFFDFGGYCPDPVTLLSAAAQRTRSIRLRTAAVTPAFTHPLKLASQLAMLDNLSRGRLDVGFARSFLPTEFDAFQIPLDESWSYFEEAIGAIRWLWTNDDAVWRGRRYHFGPVRILPRPFQQPHPPIWITANYTPEHFDWPGRQGYYLMLVPFVSPPDTVANLTSIYREAWRKAGHPPGQERLQMTYHCYLAEDGEAARCEAQRYFEDYRAKVVQALETWKGRRTDQYPGYEHVVSAIQKISYGEALREVRLLVGTTDEVARQVDHLRARYGDHELSLQVNFGNMPIERARRTLGLFASGVMPRFRERAAQVS